LVILGQYFFQELQMALAIVMVGLPARGKTYTARKISRYLSWRGFRSRVFNVGSVRRKMAGAKVPHSFFDPSNSEGKKARKEAASVALDEMMAWFAGGGNVGIYDATNSTKERRGWVKKRLEDRGIHVAFLESICHDPAIIEANIREHKISSPDYEGIEDQAAVIDFRSRIAHYDSVYASLDSDEGSWIQIVDAGRQVIVNELHSYLETRIATFVMNLHLRPKTIYLSRHGQSMYNLQNRVGGNSSLSPDGRIYAESLAKHFAAEECPEIWTSTLNRTLETAEPLGGGARSLRALDEINAGLCDGLTYPDIDQDHPAIAAARRADKLRYRYPQGESYEDVIERLEPVIFELEHSRNSILVIAHQAILRALYAYFANRSREDVPYLSIPLHSVIELRPQTYGCVERRVALPPQIDEH
jgi:broad specificity phosphatase PhoE/predicted kinase